MKNTILLIIGLFISIALFGNPATKTTDDFTLEEENYVDDINFDTEKIYKITTLVFNLEEEDYVDDIDFDTEKIFKKYMD